MILWSYVKEWVFQFTIKSLLGLLRCVVGTPWRGTNIGIARAKSVEYRTL